MISASSMTDVAVAVDKLKSLFNISEINHHWLTNYEFNFLYLRYVRENIIQNSDPLNVLNILAPGNKGIKKSAV